MLEVCLDTLARLVAFRTENPGPGEPEICAHLAEMLGAHGADDVETIRVPRGEKKGGDGAYVYARYGEPKTLINVHVDTVPANTGWTRDPFELAVDGGRAYGLGSADTKGAIAAVLSALGNVRPRDVGILFSGDEECGSACMRAFLESGRSAGLERAVVCEPTGRRGGVRHRGVAAYRATMRGHGGHSSIADELPKPMVSMAKLALELDALGIAYLDRGPDDMRGICMNVASIDGGVALNVVPDGAELVFSLRPPPGFDGETFAVDLEGCVARADPKIELKRILHHEPFAARGDGGAFELVRPSIIEPTTLAFWTEAALLSAAGVDAVVCGPGDIDQAHAADEFVTLADLEWATELFERIFKESKNAT